MSDEAKFVTIDGTQYLMSSLSENAKAQLVNLQVTDAEIERAKARIAIFQTARAAYARTLKDELDKSRPM